MLNKRFFTTIFAVGILSVSSIVSVARADVVIYDSLNSPPAGGDSGSGDYISTSPGQSGAHGALADSFSVSGSTTITDVKLDLVGGDGTTADYITVKILTDSGSHTPGSTVLYTNSFSTILSTSPAAPLDLSGLSVLLATSGRYWVSVSSTTAGSTSVWEYENDATGTGTSAEYNASANNGSHLNSVTYSPYMMIISTSSGSTAVPEPGTLALVSLGLAGMGFVGKRRKLS